MVKLLLVDDHSLVRTAMKRLLEDVAGFKIVGEAGSGEEVITLLRTLSPDVVLMDISMPGMGGLKATIKLQRFHPDIKIVVITVRDDLFFTERLLQAGALGYLTKDAPIDDLVHAIKAVHLGQRYIAPDLATQLAFKQITKKGGSPFEQLSGRELQVSLLIVRGIKVASIAEQLCLSPKTVNSYRYRIFDKLNIKSDVELTHCALQYGLLEQHPENFIA